MFLQVLRSKFRHGAALRRDFDDRLSRVDLYLFRGLLDYRETQQTLGLADGEIEKDYNKE